MVIVVFALAVGLLVWFVARGQPPAQARQTYRWAIRIWGLVFAVIPAVVILGVFLLLPMVSQQFLGLGFELPFFRRLFDFERSLYHTKPWLFILLCYAGFLLFPIAIWSSPSGLCTASELIVVRPCPSCPSALLRDHKIQERPAHSF